jgi:hypothetical protein
MLTDYFVRLCSAVFNAMAVKLAVSFWCNFRAGAPLSFQRSAPRTVPKCPILVDDLLQRYPEGLFERAAAYKGSKTGSKSDMGLYSDRARI